MKRQFTKDISFNTLQVIVNQVCGLGIFYILSTHLDKTDFGEINWSLAVLLTLFGILAFGIDQVAVRRIASGKDAKKVLSVYISHVLFSGFLLYALLISAAIVFPSMVKAHNLLLLLGIGKLMIFFSTPFKQLATGLERFRPLLYMSVCSNVLRSIALVLFATVFQINLTIIIGVFIAGDGCELILSYFITRNALKVPVAVLWDKKEYAGLVNEALPQFGVAVFASLLTRFDWIFLGIYTTNAILANYSFAYKIYEMSTLPMLVIAPVLIPRFTRLFHSGAGNPDLAKTQDLLVLLRIEMAVASFVALVLNILWAPVINLLTSGKYGSVNIDTILFLSATMPFLYLNNFLWTINFAQGRSKMILHVFALTFLVNIIADIILIHFYKAEGAAIGYALAIFSQSMMYFSKTRLTGIKRISQAVLICPVCALAAGYAASLISTSHLVQLIASSSFFFLLLVLTRQIRLADVAVIKRVTGF